jgi:hypothetical protein
MGDFDTYYAVNPWEAVTTKERTPWYYPTLYSEFQRSTIYNRFVSTEFNHNGPAATELIITSLLMPHANHDPIGLRQQWLDSKHMDSFQRSIRFNRYGGKLSLNRYDDLVTYWEQDGVRGLANIINKGLGFMMTRTMDKLARDAFLRAPFAMYGDGAGNFTGSDFSAIDPSDTVTTTLLRDIRLGLKERDNPVAVDEGGGFGQNVVCITSPGVLYDLRAEIDGIGAASAFVNINQYTESGRAAQINGEIGTYQGVRFIEHPSACLFNAGTWTAQAHITSPVSAGDGAPDPATTAVDDIEFVGQGGATHVVTVNSTTGINVGDLVTLHADRTSGNGVVNGVDYTDGKLQNLRVVAKTSTTLTFQRPVMEDFRTDLGGGVYGYITKGTNVHTMLFLTGRDGVAMGVARPPTIRTPRPVDDLDMIQRFTYDMYLGYQPFNKNSFEMVFLAGSNRLTGARYIR